MIKIRNTIYLIFLLLFLSQNSYGQALSQVTIEACYDWATTNYPLIKQLDIIEKTKAYNLSNAAKATLPQININGQASYQSEVTQFPGSIPGVEIATLDKDQYKIYGDVFVPLTNRPAIKTKKQLIEADSKIAQQQIDIDLYQLKDRVNQLYFGILLMKNKLKQIDIFQKNLAAALEQTQAAVVNGLAIESNEQLLQAELIKSNQKTEELLANKQAFISMLAMLTKQDITENTNFVEPVAVSAFDQIKRRELQLFDSQQESILLQEEQIKNSFIPNIGLFAQAGLGRPALNFLSNDFKFYYIAGLKVNWNLSNYYTSDNQQQILQLAKEKINTQKEVFLLNTNLTMTQQSNEVVKYQKLIATDNDLISLRRKIKETAATQLANGLISALEYINYVNAEEEANQDLILHQTQLLLAHYNLKVTSGN